MNIVEQNMILYYADFLSLKSVSKPVTDNCKYYFVHGVPMNSAYLVDLQPEFNESDKYYLQAYTECIQIQNKFGNDGLASFLEDICMLRARGCVNANQMLKYIHLFSTPEERRQAFRLYGKWVKNNKHKHYVRDDDGNSVEQVCSMYVSHFERGSVQ